MRTVFAGTPAFAAQSLQALLGAGREVSGVLTQPDRPAGRGRKPRPSAVKLLALDHGIEINQPASLRDDTALDWLRRHAPDVMVVAAYGLLLPPDVLALPRHGCLNVHASLLPRWRGAAPIQRAILAGDDASGVCIMRMEAGLDTGPTLRCVREPLRADDTAGALHDRLAALGAQALVECLQQVASGSASAIPQPDAGVTYAQRIDKAEARIDWTQDAHQVDRQVRAFNPWPMAFTTLPDGRRLRVLRTSLVDSSEAGALGNAPAGTIAGDGWPCVATGNGTLRLEQVQVAGGKAIAGDAFWRGAAQVSGGLRLG